MIPNLPHILYVTYFYILYTFSQEVDKFTVFSLNHVSVTHAHYHYHYH